VKALLDGRSLLAAGATGVEGAFARGDVVDISDAGGTVLARGLAEYDAADAAKIVGHRSDAHGDLLGYAPRSAMVHRDHMVLV
jgi:glutamate 5-kinase